MNKTTTLVLPEGFEKIADKDLASYTQGKGGCLPSDCKALVTKKLNWNIKKIQS